MNRAYFDKFTPLYNQGIEKGDLLRFVRCLDVVLRCGLLVGLLEGCAAPRQPLPPHTIDLADLAATAHRIVETDSIDIGTPAARSHLWTGWGPDETNPRMTFSWGGGRTSLLSFDVVEPRERHLRLRGWSYPFADEPPQEVELRVNGHELARRPLGPAPSTIELDLPGDFIAAGENFLELRYRRFDEQSDVTPWAVGWDGLRFDRGKAKPAVSPRIDPVTGGAELPARTALEWALDLPGGSWLAWKGVERRRGAELEVAVRDRAGEHARRYGSGAGELRLTRDGAPRALTGVALRALGSEGSVRVVGLTLHLPAAPRPPSSAPSAPASAHQSSPGAPSRPSIVIYLIDTLRADRLGCYGYARPTSPAIDRFAAESVRWSEARAQASWTRPAVATVLTGLYPITHGAERSADRLPKRVEMISEMFQKAGYETAMVTSNGNVAPLFGFDQGWDVFRYLRERPKTPEIHVQSDEVNRTVFEWLARRETDRPFLLFVHTTDPHDPYTPRPRYRKLLAADVTDPAVGLRDDMHAVEHMPLALQPAHRHELSELYDAEIAGNDASFGRLVERLGHLGLADDTAILLIADHGEEFFEHGGWTHGRTLYEEMLRIPMVLRLPHRRFAGTVLPGPAQQIDVVPTLLHLAGLPVPADLPGRNLLVDLEPGQGGPLEEPSFAWLHRNVLALSSVKRSGWKLIHNEAWRGPLGRPPYELYSLASDPGEQHDLTRRLPLRRLELAGQLQAALRRFRSLLPSERTVINPELEKTLHALGYL